METFNLPRLNQDKIKNLNRETASEIERQWELLSPVWLFSTPPLLAGQAPLSLEFPRQYWSGLLFPSPGDLPSLRTESGSPALQSDSLSSVIKNINNKEKPRNRCLHYLILSHSQWRINANIFQTLSKDRKGGNNCKLILHSPDMEIRQGHLKKRKL